MQLSVFGFATLIFSGPLVGYALDLDSIFDEVSAINHDFENILRVLLQQALRHDDPQPINEVFKYIERATDDLNTASDDIGFDSNVDDPSDVVAAFCDDMETFTNTQIKAAYILVFKATNMWDAMNGAQLPDGIVRLSFAYDKYAGNMIPLTEHCTTKHMENIYLVKSTLRRVLVDLGPNNGHHRRGAQHG
ncbi:hypothetical protein MAC_08273 [Metarhizium acridum CQMa 102]|uniref:Uncharacterized protein n=1 Tax=Metarhizium acridum (strain CQMa 102) TaxID=655827 RepID=E9EEH5_METAQ|nr:uncharacterized protein MAC_08273 [Metarhizium acridum CQMa 102]EFY85682.1 hypothetical protein MAC_08273 [Metarhizium acridum CQMa 102]